MKTAKCFIKKITQKFVKSEKGEVAVTYILLAAGIITILAFVLVPGLRTFATNLISSLTTWFNGVDAELFGTS